MREGLQSIGVNNTTVAIFETLMDSNSLFLTGNTESIYGAGWVYVFRSNTCGNWLLIRRFMVDGDPAPAVRRLKASLRIYPVAQTARPPHTHFVNASGRSFNTSHPTDATFFETVNRVVQEEPAIAIDAKTLGLLASIGIEKRQRFARA